MHDRTSPEVDAVADDGIHRTRLKVRFHELDPNGHLNHGVYLNHFETARIEVLEQLGFAPPSLHARGIHLVVVEANVRFKRPAVAGDVLTVETRIAQLRRASSWWEQRTVRGEEVLAEVDVRSAVVGRDGQPVRPPEDLVAALRLLQG